VESSLGSLTFPGGNSTGQHRTSAANVKNVNCNNRRNIVELAAMSTPCILQGLACADRFYVNQFIVIPAKAGIPSFQYLPDSGFGRSDGIGTFYETINTEK
jgi:hypothetical protein